jgi:hypothetical protein
VADHIPNDIEARVSEIFRDLQAAKEGQDLRAGVVDAAVTEERLVKIETQTRVLAQAVVAITGTADTLAPAVQAVKDEM